MMDSMSMAWGTRESGLHRPLSLLRGTASVTNAYDVTILGIPGFMWDSLVVSDTAPGMLLRMRVARGTKK